MRTNVSVRAVARNAEGRIILIKRTRPDRAPYWVTPGGGVEDDDADPIAALKRELREELGADVEIGELVLSYAEEGRTTHVYHVQILRMDLARRSGPEVADVDTETNRRRGQYEVVCLEPTPDAIRAINLVPETIRDWLLTDAEMARP